MNRGFRGLQRGALFMVAVLCALLLSFPMSAEGRDARLVYLDNDAWRSNLLITCDSGEGCEVDTSNCFGLPATLAFGESRVVRDFARLQCGPDLGLAKLRITKGTPKLTTFALRIDPGGDRTAVEIPELQMGFPAPATNLLASTWYSARLVQNDDEFDTWIAVFREGDPYQNTIATVLVYDGENRQVAEQGVTLQPGFNFFELTPRVAAGRLELVYGHPKFGCIPCDLRPPMAGVAFVGWRAGGSPRVVPLIVHYRLAIP